MVNTASLMVEYCSTNGLQAPSGKDFTSLGQKIRNKFNDWYKHRDLPDGHIPGSGLMKVNENGWPMVVVGYPDEFKEKMVGYIKTYYDQKVDRMKKAEEEKKLAAERKVKPPRPRISSKKPLYSGR